MSSNYEGHKPAIENAIATTRGQMALYYGTIYEPLDINRWLLSADYRKLREFTVASSTVEARNPKRPTRRKPNYCSACRIYYC